MKQEKETQLTYMIFVIVVLVLVLYIVSTLPKSVLIVIEGADITLKGCFVVISICLIYLCVERWPDFSRRLRGLVAPTYFSLMDANKKREKEIKLNKRKIEENTNQINNILDDKGGQR